jgi:hypothetical protein
MRKPSSKPGARRNHASWMNTMNKEEINQRLIDLYLSDAAGRRRLYRDYQQWLADRSRDESAALTEHGVEVPESALPEADERTLALARTAAEAIRQRQRRRRFHVPLALAASVVVVVIAGQIMFSLWTPAPNQDQPSSIHLLGPSDDRQSAAVTPPAEMPQIPSINGGVSRQAPPPVVTYKYGSGGSSPELHRRKEPLENYPLDSLKMVGTLRRGTEVWAIIQAPDRNVFRAKAGDQLGQNFGTISKITEDKVGVTELVQGPTGHWVERTTSLTRVAPPTGKPGGSAVTPTPERRGSTAASLPASPLVQRMKMKQEEGQTITVNGILEPAAGIGGETTGWAIAADTDLEIAPGKRVRSLEVDPHGKPLGALTGKRVQATGALTWRHGVERGDFPVIEIDTIKERKAK